MMRVSSSIETSWVDWDSLWTSLWSSTMSPSTAVSLGLSPHWHPQLVPVMFLRLKQTMLSFKDIALLLYKETSMNIQHGSMPSRMPRPGGGRGDIRPGPCQVTTHGRDSS